MSMVALIGWQAAGTAGLLVALVAFYLPSSFLTYGASYVWDHFRGNPWRTAVQAGMAAVNFVLNNLLNMYGAQSPIGAEGALA